MRDIPEDERCPAPLLLIITFISSCAGSYTGSTLANYVFAVKAWHLLHGATWSMTVPTAKNGTRMSPNQTGRSWTT